VVAVSLSTAHSRVSDRKILARCPDVPRDQVKCRQSPDYHDFTISCVFSATDQSGRRSALLKPNWRGCEAAFGAKGRST
jgi:hypothetical protein